MFGPHCWTQGWENHNQSKHFSKCLEWLVIEAIGSNAILMIMPSFQGEL